MCLVISVCLVHCRLKQKVRGICYIYNYRRMCAVDRMNSMAVRSSTSTPASHYCEPIQPRDLPRMPKKAVSHRRVVSAASCGTKQQRRRVAGVTSLTLALYTKAILFTGRRCAPAVVPERPSQPSQRRRFAQYPRRIIEHRLAVKHFGVRHIKWPKIKHQRAS